MNKKFEISEELTKVLFEISSEQRIKILQKLFERDLKLTTLSKELEATTPEVKRNLDRLLKGYFVEKNTDGSFKLTTYGQMICIQIPFFVYLIENRKLIETHDLSELPVQFIQRFGALQNHQQINGFVKVLEKWKLIHDNADEYIFNILAEVPYLPEIIDIVDTKLKNNIKIQSVISENAIVPEARKEIFEKKKFQQFIKNGYLQRKMTEKIPIELFVNEKECGIIFSDKNKKPDMNFMLYSTDPLFHEWCLDYFNYCWNNSKSFQENKMK